MLDTNAIRGVIAAKRFSQRRLAKELGMAEKTFYSKMKRGIFGTDEIEGMMKILNIDDVRIFFINKDT